jgi:hypothetical protein
MRSTYTAKNLVNGPSAWSFSPRKELLNRFENYVEMSKMRVEELLPEAGEVLASLAAIARRALAHVVAAPGDVHAYPVLKISQNFFKWFIIKEKAP